MHANTWSPAVPAHSPPGLLQVPACSQRLWQMPRGTEVGDRGGPVPAPNAAWVMACCATKLQRCGHTMDAYKISLPLCAHSMQKLIQNRAGGAPAAVASPAARRRQSAGSAGGAPPPAAACHSPQQARLHRGRSASVEASPRRRRQQRSAEEGVEEEEEEEAVPTQELDRPSAGRRRSGARAMAQASPSRKQPGSRADPRRKSGAGAAAGGELVACCRAGARHSC